MKEYHVKDGPFVKHKRTTKQIMLNLLIALTPIILFAFYKNGIVPFSKGTTNIVGLFYPLIFILISTLTAFLTETIYFKLVMKKSFKESIETAKESYAIFPGLFLALILPLNTPISILIFGALIASLIGKLLFGGLGHNVFNPALIGCLFIITTYSLVITNNGGYLNSYEIDTISSGTPLSNASVVSDVGSYNELVNPYGSLLDFFIGTIPGAVGETSALLCLLGFGFLIIRRSIKWVIPVCYISTVFIITLIIGSINDLGIWYPLFQILSGGLIFGSIFMATDPVTSPTTKYGQVIYGVCLGILTVVLRYLTSFPEGVLTAILTMNMLTYLIDKIGYKFKSNKLYLYIPLIMLISLVCIIGLKIGSNYLNIETEIDPNYTIIEKKINNNEVNYIVSQKGYVSSIKASITIVDGKITSLKITDQNESFYQKIVDSNYLNYFINQKEVNDIDTVSGATITSTAIKKMVINTLEDYKNNSTSEIKTEVKEEPKFTIISKVNDGNKTIYTVNQKGFSGINKLKVIVLKNKIESIEILESKDTYIETIKNSNYLQDLIKQQNNINDVDVIAGATISSNSIKDAINNIINDYKGDINE